MAGKYHPRSFHKNIRDKHSGNTAEQIKSRKYRIPPLICAESGTFQDIQVPEYSSCRCLVLFQSLGFLYSLNIFSIVRKDLNHTSPQFLHFKQDVSVSGHDLAVALVYHLVESL